MSHFPASARGWQRPTHTKAASPAATMLAHGKTAVRLVFSGFMLCRKRQSPFPNIWAGERRGGAA